MDKKRKKISGTTWAIGAFALTAVVLWGLMVFFSYASIRGQEFCPNDFQVRDFAYMRVPGTKIRITRTKLGVSKSDAPTDVLQHLPTSRLVPTWHVSEVDDEPRGPAVLVSYLKQLDANRNNDLGAWSKANPKAAAVFWPLVQQVALHDLYPAIPEMIAIAKSNGDTSDIGVLTTATIWKAAYRKGRAYVETKKSGELAELLLWCNTLPVPAGDSEAEESLKKLKSLATEPQA